ncbi:hypothetical protein [Chitinophaga sancti]|uniref:Uncharacterized protein n=1 Tax=Chitinophaga sancti TaxID=1004 RepID=A0A1K1LZ20_9BACT|nr:hypothetical protein [Chitinophaga sancti]WQD64742.1 hypothetical protein U0033_10075 [Chitinophaga sancti]WQG89636.1 hypothetical protein SR876_32400 [Chitinophaga sancti]SFW16098.1 hypothetical protein SAMN05661012_00329 [Chitinophaga sancti]
MTLTEIAKTIPSEYRKEILETNMISRATASYSDASMAYLLQIWKTYVAPDEEIDMGCGLCKERILTNFKQLQDTLVKLEQQSNLLNAI